MQINRLFQHLTFYLVAWLCLANFFFLASEARRQVRANPNTAKVTTQQNGLLDVTAGAHVCLPIVGQFRTYTQVDFGTEGTKAHTFLKTNFLNLFPNGIKLGANVFLGLDNLVGNLLDGLLGTVGGLLGTVDDVLTVLLTDVKSIVAFLPQLTKPGTLASPQTNPLNCPGGLLAGDLLALDLNVALDAHVPSFSLANANLSDLVFVKGTCAGLSVRSVLNLANQVLGGVVSPLLGSSPICLPDDIDVCVSTVNSNFYDAVKVGANLALPGFNLQACLNLNLPVLDLGADVKLTLLAPPKRLAGVFVDVKLDGLVVDADASAAVALSNGQRYHAWGIDLGADLSLLNVAHVVTDLKIAVPSVLRHLLSDVLGTVSYVVDDTLCLVNYLLNFAPLSATAKDLQAVIYMLTNPTITTVNELLRKVPSLVGCNLPLVKAILADVKLNGAGFVPAPGQLVGVIAKLNIAGISARVLLEVDVPELDLSISTKLCPAL